MKSIERLAMDIAGRAAYLAHRTLGRYGITPAEESEIIAAHYRAKTATIDSDWQAIAVTITSVLGTSIRLGDRLDYKL